MSGRGHDDPFRTVHRAHRRRAFFLTLTGVLAASALAAVVWVVPGSVAESTALEVVPTMPVVTEVIQPASPPETGSAPAPVVPQAPGVSPGTAPWATPAPGAAGEVPTQAAVLPAPAAPLETAPADGAPAPQPPDAGEAPPTRGGTARETVIDIDTTGYQVELDQCLWVRMDLAGSPAPIVGAHNNCGGDIVLELQPGDVVELTGEFLDARYVVFDSRNGRPGQSAAEATAGFGAAVILQTCYFDSPEVRLVGLIRVA